MKYIFLFLGLFLVACAPPKISTLGVDASVQNPVFQPYVDYFYQAAQIQNFNKSQFAQIKLGYDFNSGKFFDNNEKTIGICVVDGQNGVIAINPRYWNSPSFSEMDKKTLFLHELSHCLLYRGHTQDLADVSNGRYKETYRNEKGEDVTSPINFPNSLMYPYHVYSYFGNSFMRQDFVNDYLPNHYLPELFSLVGKPTFNPSASTFDEKYERIMVFKINADGCDHHEENPNLNEDLRTNQ